MKLDDLINALEKLRAEHGGSIRCVTPGFDESNFDDIGQIEVVRIIPDQCAGGHCGRHIEFREADHTEQTLPNEPAISINF